VLRGAIETVGFTGSDDKPMNKLFDHCLNAPADETAIIQRNHIVVAHVICGLVETRRFKNSAANVATG
jgi:D-sedoheptulose 7-phosphate isomerase